MVLPATVCWWDARDCSYQLWENHRTFTERCDTLRLIQNENYVERKELRREIPAAFIIRRFFDDNGIDIGDKIPNELVCNVDFGDIRKAFKFHNTVNSYRHDLYSKMLSAYFNLDVLMKVYDDPTQRKIYKWGTNLGYTIVASMWKNGLASYSNWSLMDEEEKNAESERAETPVIWSPMTHQTLLKLRDHISDA